MHIDPKSPANQNATAEDQSHNRNNKGGVQTKARVRIWLFWTAVSTILFLLAQYLESFNHKFLLPSVVVLAIGFITGGRALWVQLVNNGATHRRAHFLSFGVIALGLAFCGFLFCWEYCSPSGIENHALRFSLHISGDESGTNKIFLTNDFLIRTNFYQPHNTRAAVFLPCVAPEGESTLKLGIVNESSSVAAKSVQVLISLSTNWPCEPSAKWKSAVYPAESDGLPMASWAHEIETSVLPGNGVLLPRITWKNTPSTNDRIPCMVMVRGQDASATGLVFALRFMPSNLLRAPFVTLGVTNENGQISFSDPAFGK